MRTTTISMTTKPDWVVTYNENAPFEKSHDRLIMWSSDFNFPDTVCRFRKQTLTSSQTFC